MATPIPELLAPAGHWEALKAAVANGADAVYFGVDAFNARMRAANFTRQELPELMAWLHARGVKGYLTVNVLVFSDELPQAAALIREAAAAGVDALIVQDVGLARLSRRLAPALAVHASTQMSITSAAGVAQAVALGCRQVVLARELSLRDLERLQAQLEQRGLRVPLEVFVHGALCVAYSGQCLTSEALGQRSANRGECAQACRLPYQLIVDGESRDLGEQRFLLSPQDLAAWELLPQLSALGIASLKIEGRLKDAHYVAAVTDAYRQSLDRLAAGGQGAPLSGEQRRSLELSFSRGLSTGWLQGVDHRSLVHGRWSKKRGPELGTLQAVERGGWWVLRSHEPLKPGDGLVLEAPPSRDPLEPPLEVGGRVMAVERRAPGVLAVRLGPGRLARAALPAGSRCWLTSDPALEKQWQQLAQRPVPERRRSLTLAVGGAAGQPLRLSVVAAEGVPAAQLQEIQVCSTLVLQPARAEALSQERLLAQLGRLGGTPWQLEGLQLALDGDLFLPVAELNRLRRALVDQLAERLAVPPGALSEDVLPAGATSGRESGTNSGQNRYQDSGRESDDLPLGAILQELSPDRGSSRLAAPQLVVLVRSLEQLQVLRGLPLHSVIADLEQPRELREAVAMGRGCWSAGLWLAGARITRPDEAWSLDPLLRAAPDGYLVRNADQLERLSGVAPCAGDFSLNVANPLSLAWYLEHWGLERVCASYDLDLAQLEPLLQASPAGRLEVTVHQHMPLFHMEHCLFCAFLSEGHDHTDCGRPCEQHTVLLRDRSGAEHPLRADLGCRNTLFNGRAQTAAEAIPLLLASGASILRVELLDEGAAEARHRVELYLDVLSGRVDGRQLWQREQLDSRLGVTRGTLKPRAGAGRSNPGIG